MTDLAWLDAIEARLAAATPGPWSAEPTEKGFLPLAAVTAGCPCCGSICSAAFDWDAEFIANAPADIARLVKALRDAHAELADMHNVEADLRAERDALAAKVGRVEELADVVAAKVAACRKAADEATSKADRNELLDTRDWLRDFERVIRAALAGEDS